MQDGNVARWGPSAISEKIQIKQENKNKNWYRTPIGNTEPERGGSSGRTDGESEFMLTRKGALKERESLPGPIADPAATANPFCRDAHRGRRDSRACIAQFSETKNLIMYR